MVGIHELASRHGRECVRQGMRVRCRQHEPAVRRENRFHRLEEVGRPVEVLEQLAGQHDLAGLELERPERGAIFDVGVVRLESELARPRHSGLVGVDAERLPRLRRDDSVQPRAARPLHVHLPLVDEAEVDHTPSPHERPQLHDAVDEPRARKALHRRRPNLRERR